VPNHYVALNVAPDADRAEIRAAFRAMARRYHPDVGGDALRMQSVIEAWAVLGRSDRRAAYDLELSIERGTPRRPLAAAASRRKSGASTPERATTTVGGNPPRAADVVDYGRYAGWTISALAQHDPEYLEWLARSQGGRAWRGVIIAALAERTERLPVPRAPAKKGRGRFGR
jgi:curved DNA-binding protein CbpA